MKIHCSTCNRILSKISLFWCLSFFSTTLYSNILRNGPMLSDLNFREAQIWVQTTKASKVRIHYFEIDSSTNKYKTPIIVTEEAKACTANFILTKIEPNRSYGYQVEVDDVLCKDVYTFKSPNYFHEKSLPPDFSIALLGSHYAIDDFFEPPYVRLGSSYGIFEKILQFKPDLVIWAGNTAHLRKSDASSINGYYKRYSHARSNINPKAFLAEIPNLGIWSSNDYGPKNSGNEMSLKNEALEAFSLFWPKANSVKHQEALCYSHKYSDVELFFIDVQSQRDSFQKKESFPSILGEEQINWLKNNIINSDATFKIIVSGAPILNPETSPKNFSFAKKEKEELLDFFKLHDIKGLFFVSGGSYKGELTRIVHSSYYSFYDLTLGPSTAVPINKDSELNYFRIPGTNTFEQQFTILKVAGQGNQRSIELNIYSIAGLKIWSRTIEVKELSIIE